MIWVCLKMGYIPNEIAIFHRDNDHENHWVFRGTRHFQTNPYMIQVLIRHTWAWVKIINPGQTNKYTPSLLTSKSGANMWCFVR